MTMNVSLNATSSVRGGSVSANASIGRGAQIGAPKKSFAQKLGGFAKGVASVGLNVVGAAVPGASVLTNALGSALGAGGNFGDTPGLSGGDMVSKMAAMNTQFLALQEATQMESRRFQTLSNASKARHDIAMNAIRNMKG
jgi:hypothetical protein